MILFYKNLLFSIIKSAEEEKLLNEKLTKDISDSPTLKTNLLNMYFFLNKIVEKESILDEGN
jgi:hypothetical protein